MLHYCLVGLQRGLWAPRFAVEFDSKQRASFSIVGWSVWRRATSTFLQYLLSLILMIMSESCQNGRAHLHSGWTVVCSSCIPPIHSSADQRDTIDEARGGHLHGQRVSQGLKESICKRPCTGLVRSQDYQQHLRDDLCASFPPKTKTRG